MFSKTSGEHSPNKPPAKSGAPRKLRTSCDGCHSAKVRCAKERPACARCMSLGICCVYSPSLRAGKIRQTARDSGTKASTNQLRNELDITGLNWDPGTSEPGMSLKGDELGDLSFASGQDGYNVMADFAYGCNSMWQVSSANQTTCMADDQSGTLIDMDTSSLGSGPSSMSPLLTSPASSIALSSFLHDRADLSGLPSRPTDDTNIKRTGSAMTEASPLSCPQLSYVGIGQKKPSADSAAWSSSRCFSSLVHALHTLQRQTDTSATTLDVVLETSKQAVGWCDGVLLCACASDSTVIMLLAALIGKLFTLYQAISNAHNTTTTNDAANNNDDAMLESAGRHSSERQGSRSQLSTTTNDHDHSNDTDGDCRSCSPFSKCSSPARITLGAYRLDSEDEGRLRMHLMLIELRKVDGLLVRFRKRVGMVSAKHEACTYESLVMSLDKKLRATAEPLQGEMNRFV